MVGRRSSLRVARPIAVVLATVLPLGAFAAMLAACGGSGSTSAVTAAVPAPQKRCVQSALVSGRAFSVSIGARLRLRAPALTRPESDVIPGEIGVRFSSADEAQLARAAALVGGSPHAPLDRDRAATIDLAPNADLDAAARALLAMNGVISAGPIARRSALDFVPDDPDFGTLPYDVTDPGVSNPPIEWDMYVTSMPQTWSAPSSLGSSAVRIAIIDTGYDLRNPDLSGGRVAASIVFDRGDGTVDGSASIQDGDGHGTDTSGIAAADTNNATDAAGVAGGVTLLEARVFPTPSAQNPNPTASTRDVAAAIDWAISHRANVVNMSLGSGTADQTYEEPAVARAVAAGLTVVAAAGNGNARGIGQPLLDFPAADPGVIAVGASALCDASTARDYATSYEYVAGYSNYTTSKSKSYVVAPGGDPSAAQVRCPVVTCIDYLQWIFNLYSTTAFGGGSQNVLIAGTSMAAPHVAGLAALMLSKDPSLTSSQIASIVTSTATNIGDDRQGFGRVDAAAALAAVP